MFSYGSGLAATMFSFSVNSSLQAIRTASDVQNRLASRVAVDPQEYSQAMQLREQTHSKASYTPSDSPNNLFPGTYYLNLIDEMKRRFYKRRE
jgi:hydroxymethylglutaryl-CoA synthase